MTWQRVRILVWASLLLWVCGIAFGCSDDEVTGGNNQRDRRAEVGAKVTT